MDVSTAKGAQKKRPSCRYYPKPGASKDHAKRNYGGSIAK